MASRDQRASSPGWRHETMPRPRFHKLAPDKQQRILDAAIAEFGEHGFEQASYNRIIELAEISKGAMYYYFEDKADLYVTLLEHVMAEKLGFMHEIVINPADDEPFWSALRKMSLEGMELVAEMPELMQLGRSLLQIKPGTLGARGEELMASGSAMMEHMLEVGRELGAVRDDLETGLLVSIVVAADLAFERWWLQKLNNLDSLDQQATLDLVELWIDLMRRLLEPRPAPVGQEHKP